jgi:pimeloyl-ACP methyl ester carboxylesterase
MGIFSLFHRDKSIYSEKLLETRAPIRKIPEGLLGKMRIKTAKGHVYLEMGEGKPILFAHGLFGGIYNIERVAVQVAADYRFIMPFLPMYDLPLISCTIPVLGNYLQSFIEDIGLTELLIIGSSMGGGAAIYYASKHPPILKGMILCGSSGLSSIPLSKGFFKRKNISFVGEATRDIFYNREVPPDDMIFDVFQAIQKYETVLRAIRLTKAATVYKMNNELKAVQIPTMLVWGKNDPVTPPEIVFEFQELIKHSTVHVLEQCGHVPTQEKPEEFMHHFIQFVSRINYMP